MMQSERLLLHTDRISPNSSYSVMDFPLPHLIHKNNKLFT